MKTKLESDKPLDAASCSRSLDGLSVWNIKSVRWDDDDHQTGKDWSTIIVCKDIKAVWDWLASDLNDLRTEVLTIHCLGPACSVIPNGEWPQGSSEWEKRDAQWRAKHEQVHELWNIDNCRNNDRIAALEDAIRWALGEHETDGFREQCCNEGKYWWRKELRERTAAPSPENVTTEKRP